MKIGIYNFLIDFMKHELRLINGNNNNCSYIWNKRINGIVNMGIEVLKSH